MDSEYTCDHHISVKESLTQMSGRDPDQDSLDSDSLNGEARLPHDPPRNYPTFNREDNVAVSAFTASPDSENAVVCNSLTTLGDRDEAVLAPLQISDRCGDIASPKTHCDSNLAADSPSHAGAENSINKDLMPQSHMANDQRAFFVDLQRLPSPPPPPARPSRRLPGRDSAAAGDSVYLYIDLNSDDKANRASTVGSQTSSRERMMSASYHGGAVGGANEDQAPASGNMCASSLFYTLADDELTVCEDQGSSSTRPLRQPPNLSSERRRRQQLHEHLESRRRRNLSLNTKQSDSERVKTSSAVSRASLTPPSHRRLSDSPTAASTTTRVAGPMRRVSDTLHTRSIARRSTSRVSSATNTTSASSPPVSRHRNFLRAHTGRTACSIEPAVVTASVTAATTSVITAGSRTKARRAPSIPAPTTRVSRRSPAAITASSQHSSPPPPPATSANTPAVSSTPSAVSLSSAVSEDACSDLSSARSSKSVIQPAAERYHSIDGLRELASDLMTMMTSGQNADVTIEVDGCQMYGHRCVLAARSEYFSRRLADSATVSTIRLNGHSANTVRFLLVHLYTGECHVPEDIDPCDLLCLCVRVSHRRLVQLADLTVRSRLCHMFHKPCDECIPGVLETLGVATECRLNSLAERCVSWLCQHRVAVWSHYSVRQLEPQFCSWCFQRTTQLNESTVLDVMLDCGRLMKLLAGVTARDDRNYSGGGGDDDDDVNCLIGNLVEKLSSEAIVLASRHLPSLLSSDRFMCMCEESEQCVIMCRPLTAAADIQHAADACVSLDVLCQLSSVPQHNWSPAFLRVLESVRAVCAVRSGPAQHYTGSHLQRSSSQNCRGSDSGRAAGGATSSSATSPYLRRKNLLGLDVSGGALCGSRPVRSLTRVMARSALATVSTHEDADTSDRETDKVSADASCVHPEQANGGDSDHTASGRMNRSESFTIHRFNE